MYDSTQPLKTTFYYYSTIRPDFFYLLVLGSADPFFFLKTRIKIKVTLIFFFYIFSADLNFPPQNETRASEQGLTYIPGQCHRLIHKIVFKI